MGVNIYYRVIFVVACVPLLYYILFNDDDAQHKLVIGGKTFGISSRRPFQGETSAISVKEGKPDANYSSAADMAPTVINKMDFQNIQLSDLIDPKTNKLKVTVSDVIDFAIIGNPKTGTTFMKNWVRNHPDILCPPREMGEMKTGPGKSIKLMIDLIEQKTPPKKLGYKCPSEMYKLESLTNLRDYFPRTNLVVGT